jgi:hypothetical protein
VLVSIEQRTVFYLFDKEIECVQLRPLLAGLREERTVSRVSLGHQIISSFLWEDVLFFADLYSVWMYFPSILGKEPQKVCIATNIADTNSPVLFIHPR